MKHNSQCEQIKFDTEQQTLGQRNRFWALNTVVKKKEVLWKGLGSEFLRGFRELMMQPSCVVKKIRAAQK